MYLISNLLLSYPYISKLLYPVLDKLLHFENERSCSLFLLSTITGNPTSSLLVINSVKQNEITINEGNRLLKCTVLNSPLFIINMMGKIGYLIIIISILVNFVLLYKKNRVKTYKKNNFNNNIDLLNLINKCPSIMLEILSSMIFVSLLRIPLIKMLTILQLDKNYTCLYIIDILELTVGLNNINLYTMNDSIKLLLSTFLLSFGGIAIIIQILTQTKKTSLSKTSLILYRILHGCITSTILFIISIFFI